MKFSFDEQQVEFRSQLRTFLERECTAADVRTEFDRARERQKPERGRWEQLASMGVVGLTVPEPEGGLGLGMVDLVGLLEEAGRACLPEPVAETVALVVPFLTDLVAERRSERSSERSTAQEADHGLAADTALQWMRRIAAGTAIATVVPDVASAGVWAGEADVVVVFEPRRVVLLVAQDIDATPVSSIDSTRLLARVTTAQDSNSVRVEGTVLLEGTDVDRHRSRLCSRGAFAAAAVMLGAAETLMSTTRGYALQRHQFGRPIGSFQAVKHHLASAYVKLEMARPLTYRAAWSLDYDPDSAGQDCSMAKATASEAALEVARVALQIHGAMGYTWEHDIHLWMKRIWVLASSWGDASAQFANVLDSLTGTAITTTPTGGTHSR